MGFMEVLWGFMGFFGGYGVFMALHRNITMLQKKFGSVS